MSVIKLSDSMWECSGLMIEYNVYGLGEYSVQYCGDDLMFPTLESAIHFCETEQ